MKVPWRPVGQTTALADFAIELGDFEGPLDLLLHLIEKQGLDIAGVSVLAVTDQFLTYARSLDSHFADAASEFLLVGSQLTLLKSRALLPRLEEEPEEETAEDLAARLRLYAVFKTVAAELDARFLSGASSFIRVAAPVLARPPIERGAGDLGKLIAAIEEMLRTDGDDESDFQPPIHRHTVADKIDELMARIPQDGSILFGAIAAECADRAELLVTFVAMLHLVNQRRIRVEQHVPFGPLTLRQVISHD